MPGKYFDAVSPTGALHRHSQTRGKIVDVDSAVLRQQRRFQENPKMASAFAHFQRRLHLVLPEVVLELQEVFHCVLVIGIDGDPFTTLCGRVYGVQADR
jgi:hypothetical protein